MVQPDQETEWTLFFLQMVFFLGLEDKMTKDPWLFWRGGVECQWQPASREYQWQPASGICGIRGGGSDVERAICGILDEPAQAR